MLLLPEIHKLLRLQVSNKIKVFFFFSYTSI